MRGFRSFFFISVNDDKALVVAVENRSVVFQGAVGAFCASIAPAASTGLSQLPICVEPRARKPGAAACWDVEACPGAHASPFGVEDPFPFDLRREGPPRV